MDVPLEATGAGSYSADLPLSRQGTYIVVAKDDETGEVLGTTGATLSRGEELRPTGSDRALLQKIAEFTGGRSRDTLEGIFHDRVSARLGYSDETRSLVFLGALGLLLAVAARRLSFPEVVAPLVRRIEQSLAARRVATAPTEQAERARSTVTALLHAKGAARASRGAVPISPSTPEPRRAEPERPPPPTVPTASERELTKEVAPTPQTPGSPKLSSAEILLAKKRRR